ncbi:MAG: signal recognition particle-docking protein FtsY [Gemmataceae bacterium]|nr:signal recognition particle-docking protein FtsY [Planctomycetota bacterium]RLT18634.1 MAG: signal recognition particle-docking protein FtsY [Planctomycetota bacterium]
MFLALYERLKSGLARTRDLFSGIAGLFTGKGRIDRNFLLEMEKRLLLADVGATATKEIVKQVEAAFLDKEIGPDLAGFVRKILLEMLPSEKLEIAKATEGPTVILVAGVNGSGKTTSIAKLANRFRKEGKTVVVGACDTFRAAAVEQLNTWAQRIGCEIVRGQTGGDPASVAHDTCEKALAKKIDVVILDTAGRLHTQTHLMRELEKIHRIVQRKIPGSPHEVLLVLDGTNGQNALYQAGQFTKAISCTGIILTKLDGTAKGGFVFSIRQNLGLAVKLVGVGEGLDDLEAFDPETFISSLLDN